MNNFGNQGPVGYSLSNQQSRTSSTIPIQQIITDIVSDVHNKSRTVESDLVVDIAVQKTIDEKGEKTYVSKLLQLLPDRVITSLGWPGVKCLIHDKWST